VLALQAQRDAVLVPEIRRAIKWLLSQQKPSGGWSPNGSVAECTSVTSIATLALLAVAPATLDSALSWVASQVYPDDFSIPLLLAKALNVPRAPRANGTGRTCARLPSSAALIYWAAAALTMAGIMAAPKHAAKTPHPIRRLPA
jgi:hypothetical protein